VNPRDRQRYASGVWLRCAHPRPRAHTVLLAFPHAGGSASFFRSWGGRLPATVELTAVQYPGRLDRLREACVDDVHRLADGVVRALRTRAPTTPDRRVALLGHSMGAVVAFETALRLEALGIRPVATFLSSHPAPGRPLRNSLSEFTDQALIGELRRLGATPATLIDAPEVRDLVLAGLRSDYRAVARYRPSPGRLTTPVVGLVGDDDPDVRPDDMRPWTEATAGPMTLHVFPGGHFYLIAQRDAVLRAAAAHLGDDGELPA
jgi:pyochelin biosynthesis protein PchC